MAARFEFTLRGHRYQATKIDPFTALNVMARLAPLLAAGALDFYPLLKGKNVRQMMEAVASEGPEGALRHLVPLAGEIAKMNDEDRAFIIQAALSRVERYVGEGKSWAAIMDGRGGFMHADVAEDLMLTMQIVWAVLQGTFLNFSSAGP